MCTTIATVIPARQSAVLASGERLPSVRSVSLPSIAHAPICQPPDRLIACADYTLSFACPCGLLVSQGRVGPAEGSTALGRAAPSDDAGIRRGLALASRDVRHDPHHSAADEKRHRTVLRLTGLLNQCLCLIRKRQRHDHQRHESGNASLRARSQVPDFLFQAHLRYLVLNTLARLLFRGSLGRASFLPPLVWLYRRPDLEAADDCVR